MFKCWKTSQVLWFKVKAHPSIFNMCIYSGQITLREIFLLVNYNPFSGISTPPKHTFCQCRRGNLVLNIWQTGGSGTGRKKYCSTILCFYLPVCCVGITARPPLYLFQGHGWMETSVHKTHIEATEVAQLVDHAQRNLFSIVPSSLGCNTY